MLRVFATSTEYVPHCKVRAAMQLPIPSGSTPSFQFLECGCWSMAGSADGGAAVADGAARRRCYVPCQPGAAATCRCPASAGHRACSRHIRLHIRALQAILDSSSSPYAQLLATSSLIKIVTEHSMSTQVRSCVG